MPAADPTLALVLDALAARGLRDADVARSLKVQRSTVSRWRSGERKGSPANLQLMRDVLAGFER